MDVEQLALSLAPILNHKMGESEPLHPFFSTGYKPEESWVSEARNRLVSEGVLGASFAHSLWKRDNVKLPKKQIFDVLIKLGILLPLPSRRGVPGARGILPMVGGNTFSSEDDKEFLVLMRLPLKPPSETVVRFGAFDQLRAEWGVSVKWEFDGAPYGLVERLIASCHYIGNVVKDTCWREGACFVAHRPSEDAAGGAFALSLRFTQSPALDQNRTKSGILIVEAFGNREGRAVWGALRFVISSAWGIFEEFPGLNWEAGVECPGNLGGEHRYLAAVKDHEVCTNSICWTL